MAFLTHKIHRVLGVERNEAFENQRFSMRQNPTDFDSFLNPKSKILQAFENQRFSRVFLFLMILKCKLSINKNNIIKYYVIILFYNYLRKINGLKYPQAIIINFS